MITLSLSYPLILVYYTVIALSLSYPMILVYCRLSCKKVQCAEKKREKEKVCVSKTMWMNVILHSEKRHNVKK